MPNAMSVSLHDHMIRLLEEHEKRQDTELASMDKALILAKEEANRQYATLNNLKAEYLPKGEYRIAHEAIRSDIGVIHSRLDKLETRIATWGVAITIFLMIVQTGLHYVWK
jgi:hypothetical protein